MSYRALLHDPRLAKRIVVVATLDVPPGQQMGLLMRQCGAAMRNACEDPDVTVVAVDVKTDLTGTLYSGQRAVGGRRRIGMAVTVRVPRMTLALELQDRCEKKVKRLLAHAGIRAAVAPYVADAGNGMAALATFR